MYRRNAFIRVTIISIILVILTISCKSIAGKDKILVSPTASVENSERYIQKLDSPQVIVFTESDVLSWILNFSAQNPDLNLSNPLVNLENGICFISADLEPVNNGSNTSMLNAFSGQVQMEFTISVAVTNVPLVEVQKLTIQGMVLPQFVLDQISTKINQSISSSITAQLGGYKISDIIISDGKIIVTVLV